MVSTFYAYGERSVSGPEKVNIDITTHLGDKQTFQENDTISFLMTLDKDCYIIAIYQDSSNNLYQIIPNEKNKRNHYKAGPFIQIPSDNDKYRFVVQKPFGKEKLWVFASDHNSIDIKGRYLSNGLKKLDRKIIDVKSAIRNQSNDLYGEASITIMTKRKALSNFSNTNLI